jgi:hypothetical protein
MCGIYSGKVVARQFDDHMNAHASPLLSHDFLMIPVIRVVLTKDCRNGHPGLGDGGMQARNKCLMFRARQASLDGREHSRHVTPEQSCGIEPQTREYFTAEHPMRIWHQSLILPAA